MQKSLIIKSVLLFSLTISYRAMVGGYIKVKNATNRDQTVVIWGKNRCFSSVPPICEFGKWHKYNQKKLKKNAVFSETLEIFRNWYVSVGKTTFGRTHNIKPDQNIKLCVHLDNNGIIKITRVTEKTTNPPHGCSWDEIK